MRTRGLVGMVAVVTLAVTGCTHQSPQSAATPTTAQRTATSPPVGTAITVGGQAATYHGTADVTGTGKTTIQMGDSYFEPTVIRGKPGQEVAITLRNLSQSDHTFITADGKADIVVRPASIAEGKITLPASGNLAFFCRFHKERKMAGVFNVSGPIDSPGPTAGSQSTSASPQGT
jgi:plastocyanin